jgi:hypothetical protein
MSARMLKTHAAITELGALPGIATPTVFLISKKCTRLTERGAALTLSLNWKGHAEVAASGCYSGKLTRGEGCSGREHDVVFQSGIPGEHPQKDGLGEGSRESARGAATEVAVVRGLSLASWLLTVLQILLKAAWSLPYAVRLHILLTSVHLRGKASNSQLLPSTSHRNPLPVTLTDRSS